MLTDFHLLRPWALLALIPFILLFIFRKSIHNYSTWSKVCDSHLLPFLIKKNQTTGKKINNILLFLSLLFQIIALSGPTWTKLPLPSFKLMSPYVFLLNMSSDMENNDLSPNRFERAKFLLSDLLRQKNTGFYGLIAYTQQPFVVSPITEDAQTLLALLPELSFDILPVNGDNLPSALVAGKKLIKQSGFASGKIWVLTSSPITGEAINKASELLSKEDIEVSVIPIIPHWNPTQGINEIPMNEALTVLNQQLNQKSVSNYQISEDLIPQWKDQGRIFLIPALALLIPLFRRGQLVRLEE